MSQYLVLLSTITDFVNGLLGLAQRQMLVAESEEEMALVFDLALYTAREGRSRALDRYARAAQLPPGSDEALMLEAMRHARFSVRRIEHRHETAGLVATDVVREVQDWCRRRRESRPMERRHARYEAVAEQHRKGIPIRRIARQLGMARNAVRRWLRAGEAAPYRRAPGRSVLDQHLGYYCCVRFRAYIPQD